MAAAIYELQENYLLSIRYIDNMPLSPEEKLNAWNFEYQDTDALSRLVAAKTFIISDPPIGNIVYYFGKDGRLYEWQGAKVTAGRWSLHAKILPVIFGHSLRIKEASVFCKEFYGEDLSQGDNCAVFQSLGSILPDNAEVREGDILHISSMGSSLGALPTDSITASQLQIRYDRLNPGAKK